MKITQRRRQFAANRAAEAARTQQRHVIVETLDQMMVDTDFTKLVDDDGCIPQGGIVKEATEQGRLAGAEKSSQERDRGEVGQGAPIHVQLPVFREDQAPADHRADR